MTHDLDNPDPYWLEFQARLERVLLRLDTDKAAVSASTHSAYLNACRRGLLLVPGVWGHEASPKTRCYRRAAFRYWARTQLYDRYDILAGREPRFGTVAPETFSDRGLGLVHDIEEHLTVCEGHLDAFDRTDVEFPPKPQSKSKRIGLSTLPRGWRTRLWKVVPKNAPYRDAIAVMSVIGARPSELTKGIGVRLDSDNKTLIFRVNGAKVTATQGQPIRVIRSISARPEADHLRDKCRQANGVVLIRAACRPSRLGDTVTHYGSVAFPRHQYSISPYSYRHLLGRELKTEDTGREQIAAVLGHISTRTGSAYGRKARGSGSRQPTLASGVVAAKGSRAITVSKPRHPGARIDRAGKGRKPS
jgi:hypothetical protein